MGKFAFAGRVKFPAPEMAPADDRDRVVRDPQLVVHAAVQSRRVPEEFKKLRQPEGAAARKRVERAHFDIGMRREAREIEIFSRCIKIVDQQAHAHPAMSRAQHAVEKELSRGVLSYDEVLQVERALRAFGEARPDAERLHSRDKRVDAGLPGMKSDLLYDATAERSFLRAQPCLGNRPRHIETRRGARR